jgi:dTDP-4-amino-4,6-dideoxygalactose transaminase
MHNACAGLLNDWLGSSSVLLTTSCTAALEMSALLLETSRSRRQRSVVPSFTFTSTGARLS